jgi:hypothetical protein
MPQITFTVDADGKQSLELKGPKSIHALKADFDRDLAELNGDSKTVEKRELTEQPLVNTPQRQAQRQRK